MKNNLQDYLHYYLGCSYWTDNSEGELNSKTLPHVIDMLNRGKKVQLHLSHLKDLTLNELEALALIYSGAKTVEKTIGVASNWHYFICYFGENEEGELLIIAADGSAWYAHYFDKSQPGHRNVINEHQAFHLLLQRHYDVFGLIDAGLAIDSKKIKG